MCLSSGSPSWGLKISVFSVPLCLPHPQGLLFLDGRPLIKVLFNTQEVCPEADSPVCLGLSQYIYTCCSHIIINSFPIYFQNYLDLDNKFYGHCTF